MCKYNAEEDLKSIKGVLDFIADILYVSLTEEQKEELSRLRGDN